MLRKLGYSCRNMFWVYFKWGLREQGGVMGKFAHWGFLGCNMTRNRICMTDDRQKRPAVKEYSQTSN